MEKTLERQLKRAFGSLDAVPDNISEFLDIVNQAYIDFRKERNLIERSLEISSAELTELNEHLQKEAEIIENTVETRTRELNFERNKLAKIAENMRTGALLVDKSKTVVFLNRPAREFINFHQEGFSGSLDKLCEVFADYPVREYIDTCVPNTTLALDDVEVGESVFNIIFQGMPDSEEAFGLLIWINDVTQEKILERSKSELVAVASHQLRTPLTVTKGNTEILLDESFGPLTEEQKKIVQQTHDSNENMITLVNQMLDITKIEQGKFSFKLSDVRIIDVLEHAISDLRPHAEEKNIQLVYNPPPSPDVFIQAEKTRLYQVFQNLIDNAIKYSLPDKDSSAVTITVTSGDDTIRLTIEDEGIGIPKNDQSHLFERFYRASNAETSFVDGTGLGLHVVHSIVRSFGGKIAVTSKENEGTTFIVDFPRA